MTRVLIDDEHCAGSGRCYLLASASFGDDERAYGRVIGDGTIVDHRLEPARQVVLACAEEAITIEERAASDRARTRGGTWQLST